MPGKKHDRKDLKFTCQRENVPLNVKAPCLLLKVPL